MNHKINTEYTKKKTIAIKCSSEQGKDVKPQHGSSTKPLCTENYEDTAEFQLGETNKEQRTLEGLIKKARLTPYLATLVHVYMPRVEGQRWECIHKRHSKIVVPGWELHDRKVFDFNGHIHQNCPDVTAQH